LRKIESFNKFQISSLYLSAFSIISLIHPFYEGTVSPIEGIHEAKKKVVGVETLINAGENLFLSSPWNNLEILTHIQDISDSTGDECA
jgi:hypothetical protein